MPQNNFKDPVVLTNKHPADLSLALSTSDVWTQKERRFHSAPPGNLIVNNNERK